MRTACAVAAFAAGALAVPFNHRRAVELDYDYVTITHVVTVTAGAKSSASPTTSLSPPVYAASSSTASFSHHHHWWTWSAKASSAAPNSSTEAPASTSEAPSTTPDAPSTYAAPSTVTSTYTPPPPSTTSTWAKPSSTEAAPVSSAPPATTVSGPLSEYSDIAKYHHDLHRVNHSCPAIEWDDGLASIASEIAQTCVYEHNTTAGGGGYGQNIAAGVEANNISAVITELFYNGEVGWYDPLYGQAQPDMANFESWGHFSQIVWKDTTHFGCATQDCTKNGLANVGSGVAAFFTVCNYKNPGNYANEYADNVLPSKNMATAHWNDGL